MWMKTPSIVWLTTLVLFVISSETKLRHEHQNHISPAMDGGRNMRPIIGIVSVDMPPSLFRRFRFAHSYIDVASVRFMEAAGARVVPIMLDKEPEYYKNVFNSINGLLISGEGMLNETLSYNQTVNHLLNLAKEANANGDYFPVLVYGLGFELLISFLTNTTQWTTPCSVINQLSPLKLTDSFRESRLFFRVPSEIYMSMSTLPVAGSYHTTCITPENFVKFNADKHLHDLAYSQDKTGMDVLPVIEAFKYPFYGIQWHPEKIIFEWTLQEPDIPHSYEAIRVAQYFSDFFVEEARKNKHHYHSSADEQRSLILKHRTYNVNDRKYPFTHVYFFKENDN